MRLPKPELAEFEIGHYVCPKSKEPLPLKASCALAFVEWPIVVEKCPHCGEKHVLQCEDVMHRPVFGYE